MKRGRRHGHRELPPEILIVCEGSTEKAALEVFRQQWRIASAKVKIVDKSGDPRHVVSTAKKLRESDSEVWVCFDRDEHYHWANAIAQARALGYGLALSNPCIELWGILLFRDQTAHIERHSAQHELKKLDTSYDHKDNPYISEAALLAGYEAACNRGELLVSKAEGLGELYRNPTTTFQRLVERLRQISRTSC